MLNKSLPIARFSENALNLTFAIVIVEEHLVEKRVRDLHVDQELVVFVSVRLHALMPLLKLIILCSEFF